MRFSIVALLSLASVGLAADITGLPYCSLTCFQDAIKAAGCDSNDTICQCTTGKDKITKEVTPCILKACSSADAAAVAPASASICSKALAQQSANKSAAPGITATSASADSKKTNGASMPRAEMLAAGAGLLLAAAL
ncbi:hypothetical protein EJ06DRAFT_522744 [Trichodelitschia bisporula]|uniref:CFEM domain-containing protein n=1 Tax=Trichodelitschia bisporula TaxID=703511 RepID=A0A6G1HT71_9PEZI|nr:hypothetical protein EJ06DRAFT_522744 [Trichodelitschia bisporula]